MDNDSTNTGANKTLEEALALAAEGLAVFPCRPLDKRPAIAAWPTQATQDAEILRIGFKGNNNLAIRCGGTAGGDDIFVVDIDIKGGAPGAESWAKFCNEHPEVREVAERTVSVSTPSGGWHFYFAVHPDYWCPRNGSPWPGVDIRGEGGYVLAPPSKLENGSYEWVRDMWLPNEGVLYAPPALMEAVLSPVRSEPAGMPQSVPAASSPKLGISTNNPSDDNPLEWANRHLVSEVHLLEAGWQYSHQKGRDAFWARPGKNLRDGHSAVVHEDGVTVIWTTDLPPGWERLGKQGRDGSVVMTPFDVYCATKHGCDVKAAMSAIRREMMPRQEPEVDISALIPTSGSTTTMSEGAVWTPSTMNLPDVFWESRPWLTHIRDAAWSRGNSPDAVFGALITRYATVIPPNYQIPAMVGTQATFDHLSVLVAESSGGKSTAMGIARELFEGPQQRKDIVWDFPTPSGEGLVGAFFEMVQEDDGTGKKVMVNKKTKTAVHFSVDEALGLVEASGRQGATIGSVLCTAWSGGNPGQGNASADRKRVGMNQWSYRMAGLAAIQMSLGHRLLDDVFVQQGLSGRLVFFAAEDPEIVHWTEAPTWPGRLDLPIPPTTPRIMEYERSIWDEVREQHWQKQTKRVQVAAIDGHLNLVKLKLAGIFALIEDRMAVTESDWTLAQHVLTSHLAIRTAMLATKKQHNYERSVTAATAQAHFEATKDEVKERQLLARMRDSIIAKIPEEGIARNQLRKKVTSSTTKHRFDEALAKAVDDGAVEEREGRYFPA